MKRIGVITGSVLIALFGVLVLPACAALEEDGVEDDTSNLTDGVSDVALDVNDISVLFPLGKDKLPVPTLGMDAKGGSGSVDLYPQKTMDGVAKFQKTVGVTSLEGPRAARDVWKIVGFRFDPCAEPTPGVSEALRRFPTQKITHLDKDLGRCDVSIRLVAQPFAGGRDIDTAAHLVFTFGVGNKQARNRILGELQTLKSHSPAKTDGVPLGVHPGLAADATGTFASEVKDFLVKELAQAKLSAVASMGTEGGDPWIFAQGTVKNGNWEVAPITAFGVTITGRGKVFSQSDFAGSQITPEAIPGQENLIAATTPLFKDPKPEDMTLAHKVNNPNIAGLFNTDCVSCHTATERSINKKIGWDKNAYPTPKGVTGYVEKRNANTALPSDVNAGPNKSPYNFRNFGYFGGQATISYRTVNETALLVDRINRDLLDKSAGPGPVCNEDKTWTCFRDGKSASECLGEAGGCTPAAR